MLDHHSFICRTSLLESEHIKKIRASFPSLAETEFITIEAFGIDDVRTLTEKAFVRPRVGEKLLLVVSLKSITVESQQALLKLLEEPPATTIFLFVVPKTLYVLPTLLSRFHVHESGVEELKDSYESFLNFKSLSPADRVVLISEKMVDKDTAWVEEIKFGLQNLLQEPKNVSKLKNIATLYFVAEHLQTRGAANKMLLEELALSLV